MGAPLRAMALQDRNGALQSQHREDKWVAASSAESSRDNLILEIPLSSHIPSSADRCQFGIAGSCGSGRYYLGGDVATEPPGASPGPDPSLPSGRKALARPFGFLDF